MVFPQEATRFTLAKVLRPQGVQGHLRVQSFTQDPFFITQCPHVLNAQGELLTFQRIGWARPPSIIVVACPTIRTCEAASLMKDQLLYTTSAYMPSLSEDEIYWAQLVGYQVQFEEHCLGKILQVTNFGASDLLEIALPGAPEKTIFLPLHKNFIHTIDEATSTLHCTLAAVQWIQEAS